MSSLAWESVEAEAVVLAFVALLNEIFSLTLTVIILYASKTNVKPLGAHLSLGRELSGRISMSVVRSRPSGDSDRVHPTLTIPARETERMMKRQDVILKAMARKITWIDAAEIAGMSVRNMQRMRQRYQEHDYQGLFDQRRGKRSVHWVPMEVAEWMIPAYSPQARGRMERSYSTWQGRLPQELRLAGITTLAQANQFLRERYIREFNQNFTVKPTEQGTAFRKCGRRDLDWIFSVHTERVVSQDNTMAIGNRWWQIEKCRWRHTLAGQPVTIHHHLGTTVSIRFGPHVVGRYDAQGRLNPRPWKRRRLDDSSFSSLLQRREPKGTMKPNRTTNVSIKPDNFKS
jgi:hypothetical protein